MRLLLLLLSILTTVTPATKMHTEKIVFVVDRSGSMDPLKVQDAIEQFINIVTRLDPSLEVEICLYSFESNTKRWSEGWQKMPSLPVLNKARAFLALPVGGSTQVVPALRQSLAEKKEKLTVILISDGDFDETTETILKVIKAEQAKRKVPAVLGCIGVGHVQQDSLKKVAEVGGGGYYHVVRDSGPH
jgi:Mg-chelatase subunit ChlD